MVSAAGEYLGGVISPGIEISLEALPPRAARLPRVDIEAPRHAIGKGTQEAIQAGVVYGFAGQVDAIIGRIREELGEEATADRHRRLRGARSSRSASRWTRWTTGSRCRA